MKRFNSKRSFSPLYIFLGWNLFGIALYKWTIGRRFGNDPDWDKLDMTQKYIKLMNKPNQEVTRIDIYGLDFKNYKTKVTTYEEMTIPHNQEKTITVEE